MVHLPKKLDPYFTTRQQDKAKALNKAIEENQDEILLLMPKFLRLADDALKANIAYSITRGIEAEFVGDSESAAEYKKDIKEQHRIHKLLHLALELHDRQSAEAIGRAMARRANVK
jgi:hypothetical protein